MPDGGIGEAALLAGAMEGGGAAAGGAGLLGGTGGALTAGAGLGPIGTALSTGIGSSFLPAAGFGSAGFALPSFASMMSGGLMGMQGLGLLQNMMGGGRQSYGGMNMNPDMAFMDNQNRQAQITRRVANQNSRGLSGLSNEGRAADFSSMDGGNPDDALRLIQQYMQNGGM